MSAGERAPDRVRRRVRGRVPVRRRVPRSLADVPAGARLAGLAVASLGLLAVRDARGAAVAVALLGAVTVWAGVGPRGLWDVVRPLRLLVPIVAAAQWWTLGPAAALVLSTRLVVLVALAGLVTLVTPATQVLDVLERACAPLRRVGVRPERVALVLALALRSVPVLAELAGRVQEARRARGAGADPRTLVVPLVVGALRRADALGEALRARGLDD